MVVTGLDVLLEGKDEQAEKILKGKRLGLLTNQASVNRYLHHGRELLQERFPEQLTTLFSPQHGFYSEKQDNMIESDHHTDEVTSLPVYSLYGDVRKPTREMLENIDLLLIDLMDVGTRVYTFVYTMANCLEAAKEYGKEIMVLDRPNPIGGEMVEGNVLEDEYTSFVGRYPLPMRHGMTVGELAGYFNDACGIGSALYVVSMRGWRRQMHFHDTHLPWVFPSPNMPTPATAMVYPGQVIFEGTNVSEGRGTTLPFELFGAPYLDHHRILQYLADHDLPDCVLRPLLFQPTFGKWATENCRGFQLHVTGPSFKPYRTALVLLQAIMLAHEREFEYKQPPYEYEYDKLPMDIIIGSKTLRQQLERGEDVVSLEKKWQDGLNTFMVKRNRYLLYQ